VLVAQIGKQARELRRSLKNVGGEDGAQFGPVLISLGSDERRHQWIVSGFNVLTSIRTQI
jgi:hypothetical protein